MMAPRSPHYAPKPNPRHRTVPEATMVAQLLLVSGAYEVEAGERDAAYAAASAAIERLIAKGLGFARDVDGARLFDPAEVINSLKWEGVHGRAPYWEEHFVKTHRGLIDEFRDDGAYEPATFTFTLRRTFDLSKFPEGASVRLRTPLALQGAYLRDLKVTPSFPVDVELVQRDAALEYRLKASSAKTIAVGADFHFTATAPSERAPLTAQETELYTRASEGLIRVTPRVEALARELSANETPSEAVAAFWSYMMGTLLSGLIRYDEVPSETPSDWVIDNGWYDCQLGAAFLVSLCRARGIPARIVSGHLLYRVSPISHYWAEIWLDGAWRPHDVICWDLSRAGRDADWMRLFAGQTDYRLVTQRFPLAFTGPMSVRFSPAWQMVQVGADGGVNISYTDLADGSLIYRDYAMVEKLNFSNDDTIGTAP